MKTSHTSDELKNKKKVKTLDPLLYSPKENNIPRVNKYDVHLKSRH
jgi:putative ubiquitin-RnfH superfamily antitoxin RatB of RatAB toxin-antitoxin module